MPVKANPRTPRSGQEVHLQGIPQYWTAVSKKIDSLLPCQSCSKVIPVLVILVLEHDPEKQHTLQESTTSWICLVVLIHADSHAPHCDITSQLTSVISRANEAPSRALSSVFRVRPPMLKPPSQPSTYHLQYIPNYGW